MAGRFIKLYEQIMRWEWYQSPNTLCLYIYLLLKANYRDLKFQGKTIRRGQLLTSLPQISADTGLSIQQARTALLHLTSTGEVTDEASSQDRIITVVKYDEYQTAADRSTDEQQTANRRPTDGQQTSNRRPTDEQQTGNRRPTDEPKPTLKYNNNPELFMSIHQRTKRCLNY